MTLTVPVFASANNNSKQLTETEKIQFKKTLTENFVSEYDQENLIRKLENGQQLDCFKKSELEKVPNDFNMIDFEKNPYVKKYYRFNDGSYIMIKSGANGEGRIEKDIENHDNINTNSSFSVKPKLKLFYSETNGKKVSIKDIKNSPVEMFGKSTGSFGTEYWDWPISKSTPVSSATFYIDAWLARSGYGSSRITSAKWGKTSGFGATSPTVSVEREIEDIGRSRAALARMWWQSGSSVSGGWGSISGTVNIGETCELWVALVRGNMYIDDKLPY